MFSVGRLSKIRIFPHCKQWKLSWSLVLLLSNPGYRPFLGPIETVLVKDTFSMLASLFRCFPFCTAFIQFNSLLNSFSTTDSSLYPGEPQALNSFTISLDSFSKPHSLARSLVPKFWGSHSSTLGPFLFSTYLILSIPWFNSQYLPDSHLQPWSPISGPYFYIQLFTWHSHLDV